MDKLASTGNVSANTKWIYERIKVRQLIEFLKAQNIIIEARQHYNYIAVKYVTGIIEKWYTKQTLRDKKIAIPEDPYKGNNLDFDVQFPIYQDDKETEIKNKLFLIDFIQYKGASFVNKLFTVQRLLQHLLKQGWHCPKFTHEQLTKDLQRLHNTKLSRNISKQQLALYRTVQRTQPGLYILAHYNDHYKLLESRWRPTYLYNAIHRVIKLRKNVDLISLLMELNYNGTFFIQPNLYRLILRLVGITKMQIYDPYPTANKAVAAVMEGCSYHGYDNPELEQFLGAKFHNDDLQRYDAILVEHRFKQSITQEEFSKYSALADTKIFFCKREDKGLFPTPSTILPIHTRIDVLEPDYLLVYL